MTNKYQEAFNSLIFMLSGGLRTEYLNNERIKEDLATLKELIDNYKTQEKALLLACEKISFGEETEEAETQEEAQDNYIYKKYTRPKELMEKYIKKARKDI